MKKKDYYFKISNYFINNSTIEEVFNHINELASTDGVNLSICETAEDYLNDLKTIKISFEIDK